MLEHDTYGEAHGMVSCSSIFDSEIVISEGIYSIAQHRINRPLERGYAQLCIIIAIFQGPSRWLCMPPGQLCLMTMGLPVLSAFVGSLQTRHGVQG